MNDDGDGYDLTSWEITSSFLIFPSPPSSSLVVGWQPLHYLMVFALQASAQPYVTMLGRRELHRLQPQVSSSSRDVHCREEY